MVYVLDGGGPKDSENTFNSFLTKRDNDVFWQIGADMYGSYDTKNFCWKCYRSDDIDNNAY